MSLRKIIHVDMDAFYASIEQRDHPEYRGKPLAVGHAEGRGVVSAASYEARKFGVRSAMPSYKALELCPHLIFAPGRMNVYKQTSLHIREIFHRYTDIIEPLSLDEAFLDVTENKKGIPLAMDIAREIKAAIREELDLTASAGISYNKVLAKIASDYKKPDGLCTIHPSRALEFIERLPVESFWGVGRVTAERMHSMGIINGKILREKELDFLVRHFGKMGVLYYHFARGVDDRPVEVDRERKSVGCEHTFTQDVKREDAMYYELAEIAGELSGRLQRAGFQGNTLTLKVKFPDFTQRTKSITLPDTITEREEILSLAQVLLRDVETGGQPFRLLGLTVSNPRGDIRGNSGGEQLCLDF